MRKQNFQKGLLKLTLSILKAESMASNELDKRTSRISDILEQIEELNKLIEFQRIHHADDSTISQYEYMRKGFVDELSLLLQDFKLRFPSIEIAA